MLRLLTLLRRELSAEQARAAVEMARLRQKAVDKFGADASQMFFTREALEQASDPRIRKYRAERIAEARRINIIDVCCGIGSDSLTFAKPGAEVLGLERDPVRVAVARHNAVVLGLSSARFEVADVRDGLPFTPDVIFYDPARRDAQGRRIYHVEYYQPPLSLVKSWDAPRVAVKLSPGVDLAQLNTYQGAVEFISVEGDLKEAVLWLGDAAGSVPRATLILGDAIYHFQGEHGASAAPFSEPRRWLIEPDPGLLRAGLVQDVAVQCGGYMLDETIAYFTSDERPDSPWVRVWEVLDWMPFNLKRLRSYLRERSVGTVTVKKRGVAMTPETLIPQLKLRGDNSRTLVLTRFQGQPVVIVCRDIAVP